jgi:hypothetical protein
MPSAKRPGKRHLYVEIPEALGARLDAEALRNRRSITMEVRMALEAHLGVVPDNVPAPAKKTRQRKEK